eukprot:scaffold608_cov212-Cylindrotheca_fusiformis.AAC.1
MERYLPSAVTISESQQENRVHDASVSLTTRSRNGFTRRVREGETTVGKSEKLSHRSEPGEREMRERVGGVGEDLP